MGEDSNVVGSLRGNSSPCVFAFLIAYAASAVLEKVGPKSTVLGLRLLEWAVLYSRAGLGPEVSHNGVRKRKSWRHSRITGLLLFCVKRTCKSLGSYDASRFSWKIEPAQAEQAEYVMVACHGVIVVVFKANEWLPAKKGSTSPISQTNMEIGEGKRAVSDIAGCSNEGHRRTLYREASPTRVGI